MHLFTFESELVQLESNVWGKGFMIPREVSDELIKVKSKRYIFTINGGPEFRRSILSKGNREYFLYVSKELTKSQNVKLGDRCALTVREDKSELGMEMPEEFQVALDMFEEAAQHFNKFTPGKKRTLIYMVDKLKRPESRAKKAIQIVEYLEVYNGKLDFKELNKWFKMQNSR